MNRWAVTSFGWVHKVVSWIEIWWKCYDVEITKDLKYYINVVEKSCNRFERIHSNFEKRSTMGRILSNSISCYRGVLCGKECHWCSKLHCLILISCHSYPNLQWTQSWWVNSHQHWGKILHQQKDYDSLNIQMMISTFKQWNQGIYMSLHT